MDRRLLLLMVSASLIAAGPVEEGHRSTVGLGYQSTEQLSQLFTAREGLLLLEHTAQDSSGWTLSVQGSTAVGSRDYGGAVLPWQSDFAGTLGVRVGYHGENGGIELGPGWWFDPTVSGVTVSSNAWLGPQVFHGWLATWPGEFIGDIDTARFGVGVGHRSERVNVQLGRWASSFQDAIVVGGNVEVAAGEDLWIGARIRGHNGDSWSGQGSERRIVLTVSADPRALLK